MNLIPSSGHDLRNGSGAVGELLGGYVQGIEERQIHIGQGRLGVTEFVKCSVLEAKFFASHQHQGIVSVDVCLAVAAAVRHDRV
ncbi:MAG: hypothetical protein CMO37_00465, partial [Verrucomicrobiaceae bacterium]|nr:hypothetical protein [Verrucomicrobiaceae bacterium]